MCLFVCCFVFGLLSVWVFVGGLLGLFSGVCVGACSRGLCSVLFKVLTVALLFFSLRGSGKALILCLLIPFWCVFSVYLYFSLLLFCLPAGVFKKAFLSFLKLCLAGFLCKGGGVCFWWLA